MGVRVGVDTGRQKYTPFRRRDDASWELSVLRSSDGVEHSMRLTESEFLEGLELKIELLRCLLRIGGGSLSEFRDARPL